MMSVIMAVYWIAYAAVFLLAVVTLRSLWQARSYLKWQMKTEEIEAARSQFRSIEEFLGKRHPVFPVMPLVRILPGTFIGFGILGTFLGFAEGIGGIDMSGSSDEIFGGIGVLLSGMQTAFGTSIIGMIASVFFSISFQFPIHGIRHVLQSPADESLDSLRQINTVMEGTKRAVESLSEQFSSLHPASSIQQSLEELRHIGSVMQETKSVVETLTSKLVPFYSSNETMRDYLDSLRQAGGAVREAKAALETLPGKFADVGKTLDESTAPVRETFAFMNDTLRQYADQTERMQNSSEKISSAVQTLSESETKIMEEMFSALEKSNELNQSIIWDRQSVLSGYNEILETYRQLDENIAAVLEKLNVNVMRYSETLENTLAGVLEQFKQAAKEMVSSFAR